MHVDQAGRPTPRWAGSHGPTRPTCCARSYRDEQGRPRKETLANLTGLPEESTAILEAAGFAGVAFTDVAEPVYYGPDVAAALDWVRGFTCTSEVLKRLDPAAAARAVGRLREALAAHLSDDGVWFNSRAWIVTARRR